MNIGEYIKKLREEKNLSINQLALYSDVSAAHISRIERGLREPSPDILKKLATHLGVTYEELMYVAGYIKTFSNIKKDDLQNEILQHVIPVILKHLTEQIFKNKDCPEELKNFADLNEAWNYLNDDEKVSLINSAIKKITFNTIDGTVKLTQYFNEENLNDIYLMLKEEYEKHLTKQELTPEEKYPEITDVEEAMKIILEQPGLMLNGELLTDEDKIILANSIQIGLRLAEERRRERKNKEKKD
ncbi:MAG: helix-turn-helix transcriptional regulator [Thermosipho sp. (in: Bacteria)]|nr:helix-turn-helix transcriptional regulator [Thermosipho sp. (in: thermotogales)]